MSKVTAVEAYENLVEAMNKAHKHHKEQFIAMVTEIQIEPEKHETFKYSAMYFLKNEARKISYLELDLELLSNGAYIVHSLSDKAGVAKLMEFIKEEEDKFAEQCEYWNASVEHTLSSSK